MRLDNEDIKISKSEYRYISLAILLLLLLLLPSINAVKTFLIHKGYVSKHEQSSAKAGALLQSFSEAPFKYMAADHIEDVIKLDIKYQDWLLLEKDRDAALKKGRIGEQRNVVNAELYHNNIKYRAKVRLQGDMLDHINSSTRWSLRFELKKKQALFSSRRFSLVSPHVRIHQGPQLFSKTMQTAGFDIISPKHLPVRVIVNGIDWGVMLFEQAFSQSLLATNKRTEGVIVRLDLYDEQRDKNNRVIRTVKPRVLQKKTILKNGSLGNQRQIALQLVADFLSGKRQSSEVFDPVRLGQYLATADIWGAWHALIWNNWRWYYNPHTALLEPIQSDVAISPAPHHWLMQPPSKTLYLSKKMLADPIVKMHYQQALNQLKSLIDSNELLTTLDNYQQNILKKLHATAPLTTNYELENLAKQVNCLAKGYNNFPCNQIKPMKPELHLNMDQVKVHTNWDLVSGYSSQLHNQITIYNNDNKDLNLKGITGITRFEEIDLLEEANAALPKVIAPNSHINILIESHIKTVIVRAALSNEKMANYEFSKNITASAFIPRPAEEKSAVAIVASDYPFIVQSSNSWRIPAGEWKINDYLKTPANWKVNVDAGAKLQFSSKGGLMVFGKLNIKGELSAPVIFESQPNIKQWSGITIFGNSTKPVNTIQHLIVNNSGSPKLGLWHPRGAFIFINSLIKINNLEINNNQSEDALNIIDSEIAISALTINNTLSDAFDCDFCRGHITNSSFNQIGFRSGGDGIDVSGSELLIENVIFNGIRDKAISGGEASTLIVKNIHLNKANFGIVAKDATKITASNINAINVAHKALMSYSKKSIFGPAQLLADGFVCLDKNCDKKLTAETGSQLAVNGKQLDGRKINIKDLYNTIMKSDKPK